ncbi:MAG TPA: hypothetical protein VGJ35_14415 [Burkholderiaceae bacterium]|jgi:hypothetical protein
MRGRIGRIGRIEQARESFETLLAYRNPMGLRNAAFQAVERGGVAAFAVQGSPCA